MKIKDKILTTMTPMHKVILYLLYANNSEPVRRKLWLQKEMFLVSKNIPNLDSECDFGAHLKGPFSEDLEEDLDQLKSVGLVEIRGKYDGEIKLSNFGIELAKEIEEKLPTDVKQIIEEMKSFLNDMSESELLAYIYSSFPDMTRESVLIERIESRRLENAISLYTRHKVSLELASKIAKMAVGDFISELTRRGINEIYSQ